MGSWLLFLLACGGADPGAVSVAVPQAASETSVAPTEAGWHWQETADHYPLIPQSIDGFQVSAPAEGGEQPRVSRTSDAGWTVPLGRGSHGDLDGIALAATDTTLFVAHYQRNATGCELLAFDVESGKALWLASLTGVGPIGHSKYWNRVQLRIEGGQPVVYGFEAHNRYIEVRAAADGALLKNEKLAGAAIPRLFAEDMFREFARRLKGKESAADYVEGFQYRYNVRNPTIVVDAARSLDGTPLPWERGLLRIEVTDDDVGTVVKAHREAPKTR